VSIGKIKSDQEMNPRLLQMSSICKQISEQTFPQVWNEAVKHLSKFDPTSGDELISCLSTLLGHFNACFISQLKVIVDSDCTGYTIGDLQQAVFDCTAAMIGIEKPIFKRDVDNKHINEIKKLNGV
jgi:hypothetical protein